MDLLYKNPRYFYETYFGIPLSQLVLGCMMTSCVVCMICSCLKKRRSILWITSSGVYITILLVVTLINPNRVDTRGIVLNPLVHFNRIITGNAHYIRETLSNILLYIPLGVIIASESRRINCCIIWLLITSAFIESFQFIFSRGCCEVPDVVANVAGGAIGFALMRVLIIFLQKNNKETI